ncbi:substrate-binding periplasmic protein [Colwellia sp. 12G3]|uniref:substrate-binding periplasmic protein n=1 Tax=Colwellia sp. 12G3 TaxID=2058299 RepID=UPI0012FE9D2F|nr:transporter substrate-binding domain-containing protein [Colwellia sp. 12G3]
MVTEHLPPYQIVEKGQVIGGSSYLIMKEVLKRANIQAPHEVLPWARAYKMGLSRDNTIIYSITRSVERELLFRWVGQLQHLNYTFVSTKYNQDINIKTIRDALNYRVVTVRDSFEANSLQRMGFKEGVNLYLVVDDKTVWKMLEKGRADITYANTSIFFEPNVDKCLFKEQGPVIETFELYVAVSLNTDEKVIDKLKSALQRVKQAPSFKELFNK